MHTIALFPLPRKIGETQRVNGPDGKVAFVKRIRAAQFVLRKEGCTVHARFGNAKEIREDIAYFMEGGGLPRGSMW